MRSSDSWARDGPTFRSPRPRKNDCQADIIVRCRQSFVYHPRAPHGLPTGFARAQYGENLFSKLVAIPLVNNDHAMKHLFGTLSLLALWAVPLTVAAKTTKHDFGNGVVAEVYKHASGDDLWIYRFEPVGHNAATDSRPAAVFFFGGGWNSGSVG